MSVTTIRFLTLILSLVMFTLAACMRNVDMSEITSAPSSQGSVTESSSSAAASAAATESGQIYLYGEHHSEKIILEREFELWSEYYRNENMRHLFIEVGYFSAEYFNLWMKADNDEILEAIFADLAGTAMDSPETKDFYRKIKSECPETIFHGTDIGHVYDTTGERYLRYLAENSLKESEQYALSLAAIEQGKHFYRDSMNGNYDHVYRENMMAENFIREFDRLDGESIMGIYGGAHTVPDAMDINTGTVPCMANQLTARYGDDVHAAQLQWMEVSRVDTIEVNGKKYDASYFGKQDLTGFRDFVFREFWRLENAYEDFRNKPVTGDHLPNNEYNMLVEAGQVYVMDITKRDGTIIRVFHRSDKVPVGEEPVTTEFLPSPDSMGIAEILAAEETQVEDKNAETTSGSITYTHFSVLPSDALIGDQIGIIGGEKDHKVYSVTGFSTDEWVIEHFDVIMSVRHLYKADDVTDIPAIFELVEPSDKNSTIGTL